MRQEQLHAAQEAMVAWLSNEHELGKKPSKMECAGEFELHEMHYYIFKFKASVFGKWMVGVCGGFEEDGLVPCGHTFSEMGEYRAASAQEDCVAMVEMIRAYWKNRAKDF